MEGFTVAKALEGVSSVISTVVDTVASNPITLVFIGMGVVGAGVGLFRKLMRSGK